MSNDFRWYWARGVLAFINFLWGCLLIMPGEVLRTEILQAKLHVFLSDNFWGIIAIVMAIVIWANRGSVSTMIAHGVLLGFWNFVITLLLVSGFSVTTFLVVLPYLAMSLLHLGEFLAAYSRTRNDEK